MNTPPATYSYFLGVARSRANPARYLGGKPGGRPACCPEGAVASPTRITKPAFYMLGSRRSPVEGMRCLVGVNVWVAYFRLLEGKLWPRFWKYTLNMFTHRRLCYTEGSLERGTP